HGRSRNRIEAPRATRRRTAPWRCLRWKELDCQGNEKGPGANSKAEGCTYPYGPIYLPVIFYDLNRVRRYSLGEKDGVKSAPSGIRNDQSVKAEEMGRLPNFLCTRVLVLTVVVRECAVPAGVYPERSQFGHRF